MAPIHPEIRQRARQFRKSPMHTEQLLWDHLRNRQLAGLKFRRQHPIGPYIVDFYCAQCRLIIEVDGPSHQQQTEYDAERTRWLNEQGYRVIRFSNTAVTEQIELVMQAIVENC